MEWQGKKLKKLVAQTKYTQEKFSNLIGVSRQTFYSWISGQVPKGSELLKICDVLSIQPRELFWENIEIICPQHRAKANAKINHKRQKLAHNLIDEYKSLFQTSDAPVLDKTNETNDAIQLASAFRQIVGLKNNKPMDYIDVFLLASKLNICIIPKKFPKELKSSAFYTKINNNKIIFINTTTNSLDLIFLLLHEICHAVLDKNHGEINAEEDVFCDKVANYSQFTQEYVEQAYQQVYRKKIALKINCLKKIAEKNCHTVYGIAKAIDTRHGTRLCQNRSVNGASTNLKKCFKTIEEMLFDSKSEREYLETLKIITPVFFNKIVIKKYNDISDRRLGEILDLHSIIDVKKIKEELPHFEENGLDVYSY